MYVYVKVLRTHLRRLEAAGFAGIFLSVRSRRNVLATCTQKKKGEPWFARRLTTPSLELLEIDNQWGQI